MDSTFGLVDGGAVSLFDVVSPNISVQALGGTKRRSTLIVHSWD